MVCALPAEGRTGRRGGWLASSPARDCDPARRARLSPRAPVANFSAMTLAEFDHALERAARHHPAGKPARVLAQFCSPRATILEGLVAAMALRNTGSLAVASAAPLAIALGRILKDLIARPRPFPSRFRRRGRQSFPSTHMAGTTALLTCLWLVAPGTRRWRATLSLATLGGLVVAIERLTAGAHWPSDIAAGALLGGIAGIAVAR